VPFGVFESGIQTTAFGGADAKGDRFDGEVLGIYRFQEGRLARAQMFYFDAVAVKRFLANARNLEGKTVPVFP
jgi:hypothetical protein